MNLLAVQVCFLEEEGQTLVFLLFDKENPMSGDPVANEGPWGDLCEAGRRVAATPRKE